MDEVDWAYVARLLDQLYGATDSLETIFPGRKFTLDGHLVGSIGEVVAAYMFGLELNPASTKAHDARTKDGREVEIKLTQGRSISLRHEPEHLLVLSRPKGERITVVYNGPGASAWREAGKLQSNGQRAIGLARLRALDGLTDAAKRLELARAAPV